MACTPFIDRFRTDDLRAANDVQEVADGVMVVLTPDHTLEPAWIDALETNKLAVDDLSSQDQRSEISTG